MKKTIKEVVKMAAFYASVGFVIQILFWNLIIASTPVAAQNLRDVKISVNVNNVKLERALQIIESKTNFIFSYLKDEIPADELVSLNCTEESLYDVLCDLGKNIGLNFSRINEYITIKKNSDNADPVVTGIETCTIKGYVTDADTKEALQGVTVKINGTTIGTFTDKRGYYEINNLKPGKYSVVASYVGYASIAKDIVLTSGKTIEINFQMGQSAMNLDEVVVTGSLSERSIKESANPITIISPKELESRDLSSISTVLSAVPGIMPLRTSWNSSAGKLSDQTITTLNIRGFSPSAEMEPNTKVLLDGVELYDPLTVNLLDLNQIERIEISRGPMSSTLYGAGSSGGVIQLFTKKGSGDLRINFRSMFTSQENQYQDNNPLNSEYTLSINGGKGDFGYRTSVTYTLTPNKRFDTHNGIDETSLSLSGGVFGVISNVKVDLNADYNTVHLGAFNDATWYKIGKEEGWLYADDLNPSLIGTDTETKVKTTNIGLTLKQPITDNIYHNLTLGTSGYNWTYYDYTPNSYWEDGSLYYYSYLQDMRKNSAKYFININQPLFNNITADITAGMDYSRSDFNTVLLYTSTVHIDNMAQYTTPSVKSTLQIYNAETTGMFAESVWKFNDVLFLTTGIRFEKNTTYADENKWFSMPRIGLTYIAKLGDFTFKPRVSWGKSTQALSPTFKIERIIKGSTTTTIFLKNDDLKPQSQSGYEAGADIFFTNNISFGFTYYNQKVSDLVQLAKLPSTIAKTYYYQYQNVSEAFNKGVEMSMRMIFHPLTFDFSYTYCKSTYGKGFPASSWEPYLVEGGRVISVPSGTFFARASCLIPSILSWTDKGGSVSLEYSWSGDVYDVNFYEYNKKSYNGEVVMVFPYEILPSNSQINLRGDYSILEKTKIFFDINNLLNDQGTKSAILRGRRISFGLNVSF